MRVLIILSFLFILSNSFSQTLIAKTEDGRRVILNDDKTWEFIDKIPSESKEAVSQKCDLPEDYKEPEGNKKIQGFLKKVDATTEDLKKHVAVDQNCSPKEVVILSIAEQKGNGNYVLCVRGKEVRYRRIGSAFLKSDEDPFPKKN